MENIVHRNPVSLGARSGRPVAVVSVSPSSSCYLVSPSSLRSLRLVARLSFIADISRSLWSLIRIRPPAHLEAGDGGPSRAGIPITRLPMIRRKKRRYGTPGASTSQTPDVVRGREFDVVAEQLRKVMNFMHQASWDGHGRNRPSSKQQPPPPPPTPPPHDQSNAAANRSGRSTPTRGQCWA
ncbi:hypothetical protein Sjap_007502 [Stephania japonica]|uniref:Uncharacterized protein n=1 Tax=Stephania japonica TaxID=461633 RepID=A0AAP0JPF5_9MAGN